MSSFILRISFDRIRLVFRYAAAKIQYVRPEKNKPVAPKKCDHE